MGLLCEGAGFGAAYVLGMVRQYLVSLRPKTMSHIIKLEKKQLAMAVAASKKHVAREVNEWFVVKGREELQDSSSSSSSTSSSTDCACSDIGHKFHPDSHD